MRTLPLSIAVTGLVLGLSLPAARAACEPGAQIDNTTVTETKQKIEAAGYTGLHDLKKGCDNFWHGQAMKDGQPVFVLVTPEGDVKEENG